MNKKNGASTEHKYLQIAEALEKLIQEEVLAIGDKLPSIRILSEEYGISIGTALQSYYHLEGKGLVEARPKSGYYVRFNNKRLPTTPTFVEQAPIASEISVEGIIENVFRNLNSQDLIDVSQASPAVELLPAAKLNKSVVWALRNSETHCLQYEDVQGNKELRNQIARLSFNWGGKIKPDEVLVTAGCMEALG
ncbi:MAG: GntR family transcriptional regulator, partial [Flavisolibacter sp.]|nr:GntR family transcriptional regulator [Flavisolibacter sp.]